MSVLNTRTLNMMARGVLETVDDASGVQVLGLSLLEGESKSNVERMQNYGFSSHPMGEAEAVVIFPGGDRSAGVVVALDERGTRMTGLGAGEVAVYCNSGDSIVLGMDGKITITTKNLVIEAAEKVTISAPGGVEIDAPTVTATGDVIAGTISLQNHVHGGVDPGGSNTTGPV